MGFRQSLLLKTVSASFLARLAFVFLVSTQSISLAHEISHHQHEASEVCDVLNVFSVNNVIVPTEPINLRSFNSTSWDNTDYSFFVDRAFIFVQRSRSPPSSE